MQSARILLALILLALASPPIARADATNDLETAISGNWLVEVAGDTRTRTLKILGLDGKSDNGFILEAVYGWSTEGKSAVDAEVIQTGERLTLMLTTGAGSKIKMVQGADGIFVGSLALKGNTWFVTAKKISAEELESVQKAELSKVPNFEQPSADVPAVCASFVGGWTGFLVTNRVENHRVWLWIVSVNASCVATYHYSISSIIPDIRAFKTAAIRNGVLEIPSGKGTIAFEVRGDKIFRRYRGSDGETTLYMGKTPEGDALAALRVEQNVARPRPFPPGGDVPATCADFFGKWMGKWFRGNSEQWLQVFRVFPDCTADIGLTRSGLSAESSRKAKIKDGYLTFTCNGGTCSFSRKGDILRADFYGPGGNANNGEFRKVE